MCASVQGIVRWVLAMTLLCCSAVAMPQEQPGTGSIDVARYDSIRRELVVAGWAASNYSQVFVTGVRVELGSHVVYQSGRWEHQEREDVAQATKRPDWLFSGFRIVAHIPVSVACSACDVRVQVRLGNGKSFELQRTAQVQPITAAKQPLYLLPAWIILALLSLPLWVILASGVLPVRPVVQHFCNSRLMAGAMVVAFMTLIASGTSGSSLPLLLQGIDVIDGQSSSWLGQARSIRSDEWEVITPMALSQQAHQPRYPIVNANLGEGGQNMLVVGMSGLPVAHMSTLVKPATWGFFVLPLPQALAWYWWFPFFSCFAVLWVLLLRLGLSDWRVGAIWAAAISYSPYSVAFSGWPAYLLFFGVFSLLCVMQILRNSHWAPAAMWGVLLGCAVSGYILVLYPAWQISLGYLLWGVTLAWCWGLRRSLFFGRSQFLALLLSIGVTVLLLGAWWQDAAPAIHSIQETIYPGRRSANVGGDIDSWFFIKGLLSINTMYQTPPLMDASDAGSIVWLLIPLALAMAWQCWRQRRLDAMGWVLAAYIVFALWYAYIGLPEPLARISLWGRVISYRLDLALGLAQLLLLAWLWRFRHKAPRWLALLAAALSLIAFMWCWQQIPVIIANALSPGFLFLSALVWSFAAYCLVVGRLLWGSAMVAGWMLVSALPFNPLVQAPTSPLTLIPELRNHLVVGERVAVIGERRWSMLLPAAGVAVVNAVHYHPPRALWQRLDPQGLQATVYNRYQRLLLRLQDQPAGQAPFALHSPRLDEVVLSMDPVRFDFSSLQASYVLASTDQFQSLLMNPGLKQVAAGADWVLLRVL